MSVGDDLKKAGSRVLRLLTSDDELAVVDEFAQEDGVDYRAQIARGVRESITKPPVKLCPHCFASPGFPHLPTCPAIVAQPPAAVAACVYCGGKGQVIHVAPNGAQMLEPCVCRKEAR